MKWLVLGLGNSLAGADGFGPAVVARLRQAGRPDDADFVDAHTDLLAHLHRFEHVDRVVLVDAVLDDRGGVAIIDEAEFSGWDDRSGGVHQLAPLVAVKLFRQLHPEAATQISLLAHFVREDEFGLPPHAAAIRAAADLFVELAAPGTGEREALHAHLAATPNTVSSAPPRARPRRG